MYPSYTRFESSDEHVVIDEQEGRELTFSQLQGTSSLSQDVINIEQPNGKEDFITDRRSHHERSTSTETDRTDRHFRKNSSDEQRRALLRSLKEAVKRILPHQRTPSRGSISHSRQSSLTMSARYPILAISEDRRCPPSSPLAGETDILTIRRPIFSQSMFQKVYQESDPSKRKKKFPSKEDGKKFFECKLSCRTILTSLFPFWSVIQNYNIRQNLLLDVVAGLSSGVLRIPQSMAYALLVNVSPANGLYTSFFGSILYILFGGSHHLALSGQGVVSLMMGDANERLILSHVNNTFSDGTTSPLDDPEEMLIVTCTLTFVVGVMQATMGIFRLGFVTNYLSDPLVGGFLNAAAIHVVVSQLPALFGVTVVDIPGPFHLPITVKDICLKIFTLDFNVATFLVSTVCLTSLIVMKYFSPSIQKRYKVPIPSELIVVIATILFSYCAAANQRFGINIVGNIPQGFTTPRVPSPRYLADALVVALPIAVVSFAIGYSTAKGIALRQDYELGGNQEIFAMGFVNTVVSFVGGFTTSASMSATCMNESLGGKSQLANVVASLLILFTIFFLGPIFVYMPKCVLSAIIIVTLSSILVQFRDLRPLWKLNRIDFLLWIVTWLAVILLDVDVGLAIGVGFSLLTVVFRTQWPQTCILGRIPSTDIYKNRDITPNAHEIPGVVIFRFEGALYFASAEHFRDSLYQQSECNPIKIRIHQKDYASKLEEIKNKFRTANRQQQTSEHLPEIEVSASFEEGLHRERQAINQMVFGENDLAVHHIVLDFSTCGFIDSVGSRMLSQVIAEYAEIGIKVYLANVRAAVRSMILCPTTTTFNASDVYLSVHDAVLAALADTHRTEECVYLITDVSRQSARRVSPIPSDEEVDNDS